jgi:hypothetical protein
MVLAGGYPVVETVSNIQRFDFLEQFMLDCIMTTIKTTLVKMVLTPVTAVVVKTAKATVKPL